MGPIRHAGSLGHRIGLSGESVEAATAIASGANRLARCWRHGGRHCLLRKHVAKFQSPRAYALVIRTLLDKGDFLAATGLLVQWLSESEEMPLEEREYSFHQLVLHSLKLLLPADSTTGRYLVAAGGATLRLPGSQRGGLLGCTAVGLCRQQERQSY